VREHAARPHGKRGRARPGGGKRQCYGSPRLRRPHCLGQRSFKLLDRVNAGTKPGWHLVQSHLGDPLGMVDFLDKKCVA
jgi:hypothetical protein